MSHLKTALLSGVSALAIAAANPDVVVAADLGRPALVAKAPPIIRDSWTWWVEGGAARLEGDPGVPGLSNFDVDPKRWGWEGAFGVDYRPGATGWIWSAQFRYGKNKDGSASNNLVAPFLIAASPGVVNAVGRNSATRNERHWVADFMVGRDMGLGQSAGTVKLGVRIAEIRGKTTGLAQYGPFPVVFSSANCAASSSLIPYCGSERRSYQQTNKFLGIGPRLAVDGLVPLGNNWAVEYAGGVAGLFGRRKAEQTVSISRITPTTTTPTALCAVNCPVNASSSKNGFVFNADAMAGISYAFTPNARLLINYRFDGYWNALRGWDANGNVTNLDRFYHGPMARLIVVLP